MLHTPALRHFDIHVHVLVTYPQGFHRFKFVIIPSCLNSKDICKILLYNGQLVVLTLMNMHLKYLHIFCRFLLHPMQSLIILVLYFSATKPSNQHSIKRFMDPCTNTSISPRRSKDSSDFSADIRSPPSSPNKQSTKSPRKCVSSRTQVVVTNGTNEGDSDQDSFDMELLKQATLEEEEDLTKSPPVKRSRTRNATRSDSKNLGNEDLIEINDDDSNRADGTSCSDNMNYNNSSSNKNGVVPHQTRSRTVEKAGSSQLSGESRYTGVSLRGPFYKHGLT